MKPLAVSLSVLLAASASIGAQAQAMYVKSSPFRATSSMFLSAARPKTEAACTSFADSLSILAIGCNAVSVTPVNLTTGVFVTPPGTQNSVGSVYRYSAAATTPGGTVLDALVTVLSSTNTQDATPNTIAAADVPGATAGFDQNLQPNLNQGGTSRTTLRGTEV